MPSSHLLTLESARLPSHAPPVSPDSQLLAFWLERVRRRAFAPTLELPPSHRLPAPILGNLSEDSAVCSYAFEWSRCLCASELLCSWPTPPGQLIGQNRGAGTHPHCCCSPYWVSWPSMMLYPLYSLVLFFLVFFFIMEFNAEMCQWPPNFSTAVYVTRSVTVFKQLHKYKLSAVVIALLRWMKTRTSTERQNKLILFLFLTFGHNPHCVSEDSRFSLLLKICLRYSFFFVVVFFLDRAKLMPPGWFHLLSTKYLRRITSIQKAKQDYRGSGST